MFLNISRRLNYKIYVCNYEYVKINDSWEGGSDFEPPCGFHSPKENTQCGGEGEGGSSW